MSNLLQLLLARLIAYLEAHPEELDALIATAIKDFIASQKPA